MDDPSKKDDIDAEILKVFRAGRRKNDPVAEVARKRFQAEIAAGRLSRADAYKILADKAQISAFIENTRQEIAVLKAEKRAKRAVSRLQARNKQEDKVSKLLANSEQTLADIERMHGQLTSLLGAVQDEQAKLSATAADLKTTSAQIVAHTAEMKKVSDQTRIDVPKILAQATDANRKLELWPTLRTAIITACVLTPFTIGTSIVGNELTPWADRKLSWLFGWKDAPAAPSTPVRVKVVAARNS